jgi:PAS domain S-box-containing protein
MIQSGYRRGEKSLFAGIVLVAAMMLLSGVLAQIKTQRMQEAAARITRAHDTLVAVKSVLLRMMGAESEQRDYLLTGEARYQGAFDAAATAVDHELETLERVTHDDDDQRSRCETLKSRVGNTLKAFREGMATRQRSGAGAARELVLADPAATKLDSVKIMADRMIRAEETIFDEVSQAANRSYGTIAAIRLVSLAVILAVLGGMAFQLRRSVAFRRMATAVIHEQRQRLQVTLGSIAEAVVTTDVDGRVVYLNAKAEALTGWPQTDAGGERLEGVLRLVDDARVPLRCPLRQVKRTGEIVSLGNDMLLVAREGTVRPIDGSAAPIRHEDGSVMGIVIVFRDVSERKQIEQDLKEADRRKDRFLATLAHELRNPLAPISYTVQTLELDRSLDPHLQEALATINRHLRQMVHLTDDLLDISRITSDKLVLRKEVVALADIVGSAVEASRPLIDASSHTLSVSMPADAIYLEADFTRLSQVVSNLLNNAARYTNPGGHVWLEVDRDGDSACITVRDDGIGISAEILPHIFEMFLQSGDAVARAQGGLGLGLALVRRLVDLHGGTVEASSSGPGKGSAFRVRLPIAPTPAAPKLLPAPSLAIALGRTVKANVLVVDDDPATAGALADLFRTAGHEARTAHDGAEALALAALFEPDVVVLDIGLPQSSGCDVARRIRAQPWGQRVFLIAVSGWSQEDDQRRAREAGFDRHLAKPVEFATLEKLLAERCSAAS